MSQLPPNLFIEVLHCNLPWQELSKFPAGNAHLYIYTRAFGQVSDPEISLFCGKKYFTDRFLWPS